MKPGRTRPSHPAKLRARLQARYGRPEDVPISPWERVETALAHRPPDRVPFDFWAVPEVWANLRAALGVGDEQVLRLLGGDCRMVTTRYVGDRGRELPDGTSTDGWGTHRRSVTNEFGTYEEYASHPRTMVPWTTGPSGSGRTTTLYSAAAHLNTDDLKIIALEDTDQFTLPGVLQARPWRGAALEATMSAALRNRPDVILSTA